MTILFLTFYFEPDTGPGAFRTTALVRELARQLSAESTVHVITTHPSRYQSYKPPAADREEWTDGNCPVMIRRVQVPVHNNSQRGQIRSFGAYYRAVHRLTRQRKYDLVVASSSRLFTAFLAARVARNYRVPLFLDIRDLFREALLDTLRGSLAAVLLNPLLQAVEHYTFRSARHINLVSEGFRPYFKAYPNAAYSYFTNGIDAIFLTELAAMSGPVQQPRLILYVGNIGEGQGLHKIIPQAARILGDGYRFLIIGNGGARHKLEAAIRREGVDTVELRDTVSRTALLEPFRRADYLFLHLNDLDAYKRVLPSKLFEYGATDKPIIAGVAGYAASFIREHLTNGIVFEPGNVDELVRQLQETPYVRKSRDEFRAKFQRSAICEAMATEILNTAQLSGRNPA
ncbi:glycosyltransferase family 4 protein [Spirosoma fluviale]|uniref:Glycosyltransferase involved in cell wall bisynthesis n=1 Tax=Spirosoma fluviale TaxID=1597977 RepID=A0A286G4Q6_9BACT|nr:glycosyltransferase family 4 protein [Spirosoma fluviale]SOD90206.1 Glycosyltransferase involved in cell wall bisynthesis [Spirosoma fluviale]